ncbi:MAG: hypothetical protein V1789_12380 [PVC group bacterium]
MAGEGARGQSAPATPQAALALESVRLDPLFPSTSDLPTFGKLKWRRLKKNLGTDVVQKESRAVSSGMYYVSYIKLGDRLEDGKKNLEYTRDYLQRLPREYEAKLASERDELARALDGAQAYASKKHKQKRYLDMAEAAQKIIDYTIKDYPDLLASAKEQLENAEERLAKMEKETPEDRLWNDLMESSIFNVISGIRYMEDPDEWLRAIEGYDPLFKNADSAGVGEYSILSPTKQFYDVRFKRGHYIVSLMVTGGIGGINNDEIDVGSHEAGKAIALAFDRALSGDVPGISLEKNPVTKQPFLGLVADGTNTLAISIFLPEADGSVKVKQPQLGSLKQKANNKWETVKSGDIPLQGPGKAALRYHPPEYIKKSDLKKQIPIHPKGEPDTWYAEEMLSFRYTTKEGKEEKVDLPIRIFRPPVVLVHGFTGGLDTWEKLDADLTDLLWDTQRNEYYFGEQGVSDQAVLLRSNIQNSKLHYRKKNVKIQKVDIVVHSMGGLISRYYISLSGKYEDDVRKLIMVATPNHGASLTEKYIGNAASLFSGLAHSKAGNDLHENSDVITQLNLLESTGGHLHKDVQYAVLYGRRHNYWIWGVWSRDSYYPNDGVVSVDSALLNGVVAYRFDGCLHTGGGLKSIYPRDTGICEYGPVFDKVKTLLLSNIPQLDLAHSDAVIKEVSGDVQCLTLSWQPAKPGTSICRKGVKTGPDSTAQINFTQQGVPFARLYLKPDTEVRIFSASYRYVRIYIYTGRARFSSVLGKKSDVEIVAGKGSHELKFYPMAKIIHLETDFDVGVIDGDVQVYSREGRVAVEYWDKEGRPQGKVLSGGEGVSLIGGTELVDTDGPADEASGPGKEIDIRESATPPAREEPSGSRTKAIELIISDTPLTARGDGDNIYGTTAALYGRCSWQGPAPGTILDVRVFRKNSPKAVLTMPLLIPPGDSILDFSIPARPTGWDEGLYSVRILSGEQLLAEESFEIKTYSN